MKTQTGNTIITLEVDPEHAIQNVKTKVADEVGIPVDRHELTFGNKALKDDRTLKYYNIQAGSTLHFFLVLRGRIHVKTQNGKMFTLEVVPQDTIEDVKKKMFEEKRIAVECTHLVYAGKKLEDQRTLGDYNIRREAILHLIPTHCTRRDGVMPIRLQTLTGKTITLDVTPEDTINDVKKEVYWKEGITVELQSLSYAGEKLNDRKTLKGYNITRSSVLNVNFNKSPEGKIKGGISIKRRGR